ncbi:3-deoxy-D-manno-octulosonic acid transferase [bacterium]|nr:3-deoxy-D-manno-octulosonic acid transferase [bacterium]
MYFVYNLLLRLLTITALPFLLLALVFSRKVRKGFGARLGFHSRKLRETFQEMARPRVWIHAASVGEVSAITPVARALKEQNPDMCIVISTVTTTGLEQARNKISFASAVFLLPLDYPGMVKRMFNLVEPNLLVIAETELWPNMVRQTKRIGCQLALINGRISERSFRRYQWLRGLIRRMLEGFDLIAVQTAQDKDRFQQLGANPQRLKIIGNVKFDAGNGHNTQRLREDLRLAPDRPVWVAGSTRPGEEEIIVAAFLQVQTVIPNAVLILAPRHLERLSDIERMLSQQRIAFTHRSRVNKELVDFPVILLDTMGELADIYGLGQVAFVGGSLLPFGGHNPLEPAALGVPVLVGPHTQHFAEVTQILLQHQGITVVTQTDDLAQAVIQLFKAPEQARQQGEHAKQAVSTCQGTATQTVELLQKLMLIKRWAGEVRKWRQESLHASAYNTQPESLPDDWPEW